MAVIYAFIKGTSKNVQSKLFVRKKYSNHRRNRHYFSANGPFLLLPLALKWGLFGTLGVLAFLFTPLMITPKTVVAAEMPYITLTVPSSPLNLTVLPNDALAETSSTDSAKITVSSNTYWGYTLSLTGGTDDGSLTGAGNNKLATLSDSGTIATNTWGYKFKKQNTPHPGDDKWLPGPKKDVLSVLDTTTGNGNGTNKEEQSTYEFALGAKVDTNQPAGEYSNTFTFTATVNAVSYTINFDMNSGSDGPQAMTGQTQENVVALSSKEPTKADNIFMGWCDQPTTDKNCSGNRYQPGDEITVSRSNSDLALYAIWHDNKMQNFDGCQYLPMNKQFTLVDSRDNETYTVAKLLDGKCWMTENLRLGSTVNPDPGTMDLDSIATDLSSGNFKLELTPVDYNAGPGEVRSAYIDKAYGGYYSWNTATAGTGTTGMSTIDENATGSICPKGWRLPTSGSDSDSDFRALIKAYGDTKALQAAPIPGFTMGGCVGNGGDGLYRYGISGEYWSSTVQSANYAYHLYFDKTRVEAADKITSKGDGRLVRCIVSAQ